MAGWSSDLGAVAGTGPGLGVCVGRGHCGGDQAATSDSARKFPLLAEGVH